MFGGGKKKKQNLRGESCASDVCAFQRATTAYGDVEPVEASRLIRGEGRKRGREGGVGWGVMHESPSWADVSQANFTCEGDGWQEAGNLSAGLVAVC